jgi:hypothetical protein
MQDDSEFIDAWADKQGIPRLTRQKWRERGKVPHRYRLQIVTAAAAENRKFDPASLDNFTGVPREVQQHSQGQRKSA